MKKVTVYYQKQFNPYADYTKDFSKTHTKVYEGMLGNDETKEDVFWTFNNDQANPLSNTNDWNKVCVIGNGVGTGKDFQEAMKNKKVECKHTSMSVGDIVAVDGTNYLCKDFGWEALS